MKENGVKHTVSTKNLPLTLQPSLLLYSPTQLTQNVF